MYVVFKFHVLVHQTFQSSNHDLDREMRVKKAEKGYDGEAEPSDQASEKPNQNRSWVG